MPRKNSQAEAFGAEAVGTPAITAKAPVRAGTKPFPATAAASTELPHETSAAKALPLRALGATVPSSRTAASEAESSPVVTEAPKAETEVKVRFAASTRTAAQSSLRLERAGIAEEIGTKANATAPAPKPNERVPTTLTITATAPSEEAGPTTFGFIASVGPFTSFPTTGF